MEVGHERFDIFHRCVERQILLTPVEDHEPSWIVDGRIELIFHKGRQKRKQEPDKQSLQAI